MSLVRIKGKYQVTIPLELRERLELELGDLLEAGVEDGRLTITPKRLVDRDNDLHSPRRICEILTGSSPYQVGKFSVILDRRQPASEDL
jgi:AbrB family looped-hinge helix DNA binding protein